MSNLGKISIGNNVFNGSQPAIYGGRVTSYTSELEPNLLLRTTHPLDYGDCFISQVPRAASNAIAVKLNTTLKYYVTGNGETYAAANYIMSDASLKKDVKTITGALDKVAKLRGVTFDLIKQDEDFKPLDSQIQEKTLIGEDDLIKTNEPAVSLERQKMQIDSLNRLVPVETRKQIESEKDRRRIGVIAQEVEAVLPEAVRTTVNGTKAVAYSELVGLLIEAIKEQQAQIDELKASQSPKLRDAADVESAVATMNQLYQNTPNPFSANTEIRYSLANSVTKAGLYIYDMQGKQIKHIPNLTRGDHFVIINGSELSAGMYIYTLIADGQEVATKRMILTE
jgi:hypothetical protein